MEIPAIPDYTLETCCGSGAYGDVWTAKDRSGISRAVKLLDKGRLERLGVLHREENAITLFRSNVPRHLSLVEIYHVGENEKYIYYVMDIADNLGTPDKYIADTLDERLKKGPLAVSDAKKLIESMLDGILNRHHLKFNTVSDSIPDIIYATIVTENIYLSVSGLVFR